MTIRPRGTLVCVLTVAALAAALPTPARSGPGEPVPEVVGGQRAAAGQFPWVVRLSMGCAGVLTAPRVVLTAGHCAPATGRDTSITVLAGTVDLRAANPVRARSVRVVRAAGFRSETEGRDWALVQLDRPLRLPVLPLTPGAGYDKGTFTVAGWGLTAEKAPAQERFLRVVSVPMVSDHRCAPAYRRAGFRFVPRDMLCAGDLRRGGMDACQGDSGGPLLRRDRRGRWLQVGIVSWGFGCGRRTHPGVYTQLSAFAGTIRAATRTLS